MPKTRYDSYEINRHVKAKLLSKPPHVTYWLEVEMEWPLTQQTFEYLKFGMEYKGWQLDQAEAPIVDGKRTVRFTKKGSGLFDMWTDRERTINIMQAIDVLDALNIGPVLISNLQPQDLE